MLVLASACETDEVAKLKKAIDWTFSGIDEVIGLTEKRSSGANGFSAAIRIAPRVVAVACGCDDGSYCICMVGKLPRYCEREG